MNNLLCMAVSKIKKDATLEYNQDLGTENTELLYKAMSEIVIHSAETFIQEDFEIVIFEDEVSSYQEIFHRNFQNVYDAWNDQGPNNILFLDCDTLIVSPVEVFGKFDRFQMFNYSDPRFLNGNDKDNNKYGMDFDHYFNAGSRYYPSTMSQDVWDLGWKYANDWDYGIWGTEQLIFNTMMYSQDPDYKTWLRPEYSWQAMNLHYKTLFNPEKIGYLNQWNGTHINDAKIMHLHGSRGAVNTLLCQWLLWKEITGEEFQFTDFTVLNQDNVMKLSKRT